MTIYLDLVIGLNFLVDLLLLMGANRLAGYPSGAGRAALGAALGGLYSGACLLPGFRFLGNLLWRLVSLAVISLLAFGIGAGTLRRGILFVFLSVALGGVTLLLGSGSIWALIAAAGTVCLLCVLGFGNGSIGKQLIPVKVMWRGRSVELLALHDTGNTLRDPVTGERVLVAGPDTAEALLGLDKEMLWDPAGTMVRMGSPGLRLIPYRAVGQPQGMLLGLRIRDAWINGQPGSILVAFAPEGLGDGQGEFNALIGGAV